jgi:uncharacterized lipoprotein YehR (DUF1307 family)
MKKLSKILCTILAVCTIITCIALVGCGQNSSLKLGSGTGNYIAKNTGTEIVFTATDEVLKEDDSYSVYDYMNALYQKKQLIFDGYETSQYGYYITSINGVAEDISANKYWAFYISFTTLEGDNAVYAGGAYEMQYTYNDMTLISANYGISGIPYVKGATYAFVYTTY